MTTQKPRVALVFGGQSGEHSVSCVTAAGVLKSIDTEAFTVIPVGVSRQGDWHLVDPETVKTYSFEDAQTEEPLEPEGPEFDLPGPEVQGAGQAVRLMAAGGTDTQEHDAVAQLVTDAQPGETVQLLTGIDVVFPLLHGPYGEDGTIQGQLELIGVPYVGSGVAASAVGMDKHLMKLTFIAEGLRVSPYAAFTDREWDADPQACLDKCEGLQPPLFVKPARGGSSQGVLRVDDIEDLDLAVEEARWHDPKILVEQGVDGREIECGVLEGRQADPSRASVPGEIVVDADVTGMYDFESKYLAADNARTEAPADLTEEETDEVRELAVRAFDALGGEGLARVDFFLDSQGEWIINEINTMPGFTPISMFPQMWKATGLGYEDLITELITLALKRKPGLLR